MSHIITERIEFPGRDGINLAARLDKPIGLIRAYALFAHCFTCSKDFIATRRIGEALARHNIAVLRFDFTGIGASGGDFSNTNFYSNVEDLKRAADFMAETLAPPQLLIGHSLGGAAILTAAPDIDSAKAVITLAAPSDADHVIHNFSAHVDEIEATGSATVKLGGREFKICKHFLEDLRGQNVREKVANIKKPLLVMHSPRDNVVGIENASNIFAAAKHPKSFISLDDADHLITRPQDAEDVAQMIAMWATRYLAPIEHDLARSEGEVTVSETGMSKFQNWVQSGPHHFMADEPKSYGGTETGPTPYNLLSAALGACTSMTLRMYADRKKLPLERVRVHVTHSKIHSEDCATCNENTARKVDQFARSIEIEGPLDETSRQRLLEIADRCPVHQTFESTAKIITKLSD